jgi:hypothetical protein
MGYEGSPRGSGGIELKVIILYDGVPIIKRVDQIVQRPVAN